MPTLHRPTTVAAGRRNESLRHMAMIRSFKRSRCHGLQPAYVDGRFTPAHVRARASNVDAAITTGHGRQNGRIGALQPTRRPSVRHTYRKANVRPLGRGGGGGGGGRAIDDPSEAMDATSAGRTVRTGTRQLTVRNDDHSEQHRHCFIG
jgi:hypothetical protein